MERVRNRGGVCDVDCSSFARTRRTSCMFESIVHVPEMRHDFKLFLSSVVCVGRTAVFLNYICEKPERHKRSSPKPPPPPGVM